MSRSIVAGCLSFALLGAAFAQGLDPDRIDRRSSIEFGACAVPVQDPGAVCGKLRVPQDRADPHGPVLGLPFLVLPAVMAGMRQDPIVFLPGGPGENIAPFADLPGELLAQLPLRQLRDLIVLNPRGTPLTQPADLACPELLPAAPFPTQEALFAAGLACRDRLSAAGARLAAYDSTQLARDLEDLRVLLGRQRGFKQWNVVGTSYGSRLALVLMRDAPQGIRSVVLDGPVPVQDGSFHGARVLGALTEVLQACEQQAVCAQAFPQLRERFSAALQELEAQPAPLGLQRVSGHDLLLWIQANLPERSGYAHLPLYLDRIARGDLAGAEALMPIPAAFFGPRLALKADGMHLSVNCRDNGDPAAPRSGLPEQGQGWPDPVRRIAERGFGDPVEAFCPLWTAGQRPQARARQPVHRPMPTLMTVGQFDATAPVNNARRLLADLPHAHLVVMPGRGHALVQDLSDPCVQVLAAAFIERPRQAPDLSCVRPLPDPAFLLP